MVDLRSIVWSGVLLQALIASPAGALEPEIKGESKALGFTFEAVGTEWCGQQVRIRLDAGTPDVLRSHSEQLQQSLGKIRAIVNGDCPYVRSISFAGYSNKKLISYAEMMSSTQWVYRAFPLTADDAFCQGEVKGDVCDRRWSAFKLMRHFGLQERLKDLTITRSLKTDDGADLEFTYGTVKGRIIVRPLPESNALPDPKAVVEAQIRKQAATCGAGAEVTNTNTFKNGLFSQGLSCKGGTTPYVQFLGGNHAGTFLMLAATDTQGTQKGEELAWRMAAAADEAFPTGSDMEAFGQTKCDISENRSESDLAVAVSLIKTAEGEAGLRYAVREGAEQSSDRWSMSTGPIGAEASRLLTAPGEGPWLTYRTVRTPDGVRFASELVAKDGEGCRTVLAAGTVDARDLPNAAVRSFAKLAGITAQPSDIDTRNELRIWTATQF